MATDLLPGILILALMTGGFSWIGWRLSQHRSAKQSGFLAAVVVALLVVALIWLQDSLLLVYVFPSPSVVVLGSTALPLIGLLAGLLAGRARQEPRAPVRAFLFPLLLLLLGVLHAARPFLGRPPETHDTPIVNGIILQTSFSSCSAASAAMLLHQYAIPSSETEMANLCFTRPDGTSMLGVYRGLVRKTRGTGLTVTAMYGGTIEDLKRLTREGPILLSVGLDRFSFRKVDPRYQAIWGWEPGMRHAVVLFGFTDDGFVDVGDPSIGREFWHEESLKVLWHGDGLRLKR